VLIPEGRGLVVKATRWQRTSKIRTVTLQTASGSPAATKAAMKEVLTELFSEVTGLKELMERPSTASPPNQGLQEDQTKRKRLYT